MYIISVIPIGRGIQKEELSYFSKQGHSIGTLVTVPVRTKKIPALVIRSEVARDMRQALRESAFALKKVAEFKAKDFLPEQFMQLARELSHYYASSIGAVLSVMVPNAIFEHADTLSPRTNTTHRGHFETELLQTTRDERLSFYKQLIREQFANKNSVLLIVPTIQSATRLFSLIRPGIEPYCFLIHGSLTKKNITNVWNTTATETHPIVIIGTGAAFLTLRSDIGVIVIDDENTSSFKDQRRPHIDVRVAAEFAARILGVRYIIGGTVLRIETLARRTDGSVIETIPLRNRLQSGPRTSIIDMKKVQTTEKTFQSISPELRLQLTTSRETGDRTFLFVARRGFAPQTICGDCGTVLLCTRCSAPLVLHGTLKQTQGPLDANFFLCHHCGTRADTTTTCKNCGSWKLRPLGIGLDRVIEELHTTFPDRHILSLDRDGTTGKTAEKIAAQFETEPGSILVGTEFALQYLSNPFEHSAIISLDSLFSIPDFRINERVFSLIIALRTLTEKTCFIQTRNPTMEVLSQATAGNISEFYKSEIEKRKKFNYPPYSTLIKITITAPSAIMDEKIAFIEREFAAYKPDIFDAFIGTVRGKSIVHALITLPRGNWVNESLLSQLKQLPAEWNVTIDPESLI